MNIRDLEYVVAVADLRHFGQAAKRCHVSQPTLSAQIKKLESELDVQLFERTSRSVLPTDIGHEIIRTARRILTDVANVEEAAATAKDPLAGRYRLAAFPTLASYFFPHLVPRVRKAMPDLRLVLVEQKSDDLIELLEDGKIDAALLALPVVEERFVVEPLFRDEFFVAVGCEHALAEESSVNAKALAHHQLLLLEEGHCLRDHALDVCELMGLAEEADFRATSLETLRQMVRADTAVTLIPRIAVREQGDGVRYIPFAGKPPARTIALVRRKTSARTAVFEELSSVIRTWARNTPFDS